MFLHQQSIAATLGYEYEIDSFYEDEFQGKMSNRNIQEKMKEHALAIEELALPKIKRSNSSITETGSSSITDNSSSESLEWDECHVDEELPVSAMTRGIESGDTGTREPRSNASLGSIDEDDSGFVSIRAVRRLSTVLARRSAVEGEMAAQHETRLTRGERVWSESISKLGTGFERHLLGRVTHLLSLQSYLSTVVSIRRSSTGSEDARSTADSVATLITRGASSVSQESRETANEEVEGLEGLKSVDVSDVTESEASASPIADGGRSFPSSSEEWSTSFLVQNRHTF